jgi:hypothetical protein
VRESAALERLPPRPTSAAGSVTTNSAAKSLRICAIMKKDDAPRNNVDADALVSLLVAQQTDGRQE